MPNRACPSCSEIIPDDVDYCPFCGNSTRHGADASASGDVLPSIPSPNAYAPDTKICFSCGETVPADVDYCPFCGESTAFVVRTDAAPQLTPSGPKAPLNNLPYMCLMCHDFPATDGDYCADCRTKLDRRPHEWQNEKQIEAKQTIIIAALVGVALLVIGLLVVFHHHAHHI